MSGIHKFKNSEEVFVKIIDLVIVFDKCETYK